MPNRYKIGQDRKCGDDREQVNKQFPGVEAGPVNDRIRHQNTGGHGGKEPVVLSQKDTGHAEHGIHSQAI
ncbi:hypothetical protein GALL_535790 [mine drainage metagenome]|uniref:Uncharacterized protein n=1 Tax=mine drainage metagenome TaxID=410659 RepID=A0A1J5PMS4_9ZZZZ